MFMLKRTAVRLIPTSIIPIFRNRNENDYDTLNNDSSVSAKTGWDRVKAMYFRNEFDEPSPELHTVAQSTMGGAFIGACFGGFIKSRHAYVYFLENNQATIFKSHNQAKKKLQDYVTVAFAKGAYQWGWKLGMFTGMFSIIATTISVYQNNTTLMEYVIAGSITGALFKAHLGLAATFVGAGLGAVLSTVAGLAILGLLKVTGVSVTEIRKAMYRIKQERVNQYNQALEKGAKIKHDHLTKHHEELVKEKGVEKLEQMQ